MRARISWLALLLAVGAAPAAAQVDRMGAALQLTHFEQVGNDYFYRYRLIGQGSAGERISDVYLQIWQPQTSSRPRITGTRGAFLFDALAERELSPLFGHAPLFVGTPAHWSAAVYIQGVLSWGADRWAMGPNYGVPSAQILEGFELISPALPALRRFRAVPYRPIPTLVQEPSPRDTTWILYTGVVLAPGWEASLVTGSYLQEQLSLACEAYLIENCGRYLRLVDDVLDAETRKNDRTYSRSLADLMRHIERDRVSHRNARFVLAATVEALRARPPSRRNP